MAMKILQEVGLKKLVKKMTDFRPTRPRWFKVMTFFIHMDSSRPLRRRDQNLWGWLAYMYVCLPTNILTCIHTYVYTAYIPTVMYLQRGLPTAENKSTTHRTHRTHTYLPTYIPIYLPIHIHTYIHVHMHTCIHAYMHTRIHVYMHTCIHAYMHT